MSRYSATIAAHTWTPVAVGDTANMTDAGHHTLQCGGATQRIELLEVYLGGQATSSAPCYMVVGRTSTVGATLSLGRLAALDAHVTAPGTLPTSYNTATTKPQRATSGGSLLNLSFNAFGGIVRWYKGPEEMISAYSQTQPLAELSINAHTGSTVGAMGSHMIIEIP